MFLFLIIGAPNVNCINSFIDESLNYEEEKGGKYWIRRKNIYTKRYTNVFDYDGIDSKTLHYIVTDDTVLVSN